MRAYVDADRAAAQVTITPETAAVKALRLARILSLCVAHAAAVEVCQSFAVDKFGLSAWQGTVQDRDRPFYTACNWCRPATSLWRPDVIDGNEADNDCSLAEWSPPLLVYAPVCYARKHGCLGAPASSWWPRVRASAALRIRHPSGRRR